MSAIRVNMTFEQELSALINRHSQENASGTPDFILAQYLVDCLAAFATAARRRDAWNGHEEVIADLKG